MEKENYVIYDDLNDTTIVIKMTEEQAKAIQWFANIFYDDNGIIVEKAELFEGGEI